MNDKVVLAVGAIICLAYMVGYTNGYETKVNDNNYDYAVTKLESYLNYTGLPEYFRVRVNENITLKQAKEVYHMFKPYATPVIKREIDNICRGVKLNGTN